jgi:hypothetical protein
MVDFNMDEGEEYPPSWTLATVFHDEDMDTNPNTGQPYDPLEKLVYSVANNGSVWVQCGADPLDATHQCDNIKFVAADGNFPHDTPVTITITATDNDNEKASDQVLVTVSHKNHQPAPCTDCDDEYEMDEDTDATINLKDYFVDIDVGNPTYPTNDQLTYDKDGDDHLTVQITGSKAKLSPEENWNGEEELTFSATDKSSASAEFDLTVIVLPINDEPTKKEVTPDLDPQIEEVDSDGDANSVAFTAEAEDVDGDTLKYNWTVEHSESGNKWTVKDMSDGTYNMELDYDCDFSMYKFCGEDATATYIVTVTVTDGVVDVELKKWFVTVDNVNRDPTIEGVEISKVDKSGALELVPPKSAGNWSFKYKKIYRLDATKFVSDDDEGLESGVPEDALENITYEWTSDKQGPIATSNDPYIDISAGKSSSLAPYSLKKGTHIITLRVTDPDAGFADYTFTVKVAGSGSDDPGFEIVFAFAAIIVAVAVLRRFRK